MDGAERKRYEAVHSEVHYLRDRVRDLEQELRVCGPALYRADQKIDRLEQRVVKLTQENQLLKQQLAELNVKLKQKPKSPPPAFVKPNTPPKQSKPGRKKGHEAALRARPEKIDEHRQVALPVDEQGQASCPRCHAQLSEVKQHERLIEELVPQQKMTICYHTSSGYCPLCRKRVESRAEEQPPAADLPHAQLGLNALATAALLRIRYRLPYRQISDLFAQLPGLLISPAGVVQQIDRLGGWLENQYDRLKVVLRIADVVHADETGWRINGKNGYLWALTNARHTLYHIDRSRSGKVIVDLLGKTFGHNGRTAHGQTLVSDFYNVYDQFDASQQKCLTHLLRELRDTVARRAELAGHEFFRRCKRLIQEMLKLKHRQPQMSKSDYQHQVQLLENRLDQLSKMTWNDPDADRLTARLRKYRQRLTTFLHKPHVDGTNNAAERAIRPAVVMRKITGGSRSAAGARAWSILASVMRTSQQQGRDVLDTLKTLLKAEWAGKNIGLLTDILQ